MAFLAFLSPSIYSHVESKHDNPGVALPVVQHIVAEETDDKDEDTDDHDGCLKRQLVVRDVGERLATENDTSD